MCRFGISFWLFGCESLPDMLTILFLCLPTTTQIKKTSTDYCYKLPLKLVRSTCSMHRISHSFLPFISSSGWKDGVRMQWVLRFGLIIFLRSYVISTWWQVESRVFGYRTMTENTTYYMYRRTQPDFANYTWNMIYCKTIACTVWMNVCFDSFWRYGLDSKLRDESKKKKSIEFEWFVGSTYTTYAIFFEQQLYGVCVCMYLGMRIEWEERDL